jgi:hypothetical protein
MKMRYLVVLTATEGKQFIAKSLVRKSAPFKQALEKGTLLLHPSTSTSFIYEELTGERPRGLCYIGAIAPRGTCISTEFEEIVAERKKGFDQRDVTYSWVFKKGQYTPGVPLGECLGSMGPGDFYVKGVNLIDRDGHAGVLTANPDGGTITRAMAKSRERKFDLMLLATINKVLNIPIEEAIKIAGRDKLDGAMGIPTSVFKIPGIVMTEVEAFGLHGVKAVPIASGGLAEAEGAGVFVIDGTEKDVNGCVDLVHGCKGAHLDVRFPVCENCRYDKCTLSTAR